MKDSAEFMEFINKHIYRYEHGIELASLLYNLAHNKEDIAYKIVQLHDLVFESLSNTPDMDGSLLLDAKGLAALKESRKKWIELSGKHKHKISNDLKNIQNSGCLILIITISAGLTTALIFTLF